MLFRAESEPGWLEHNLRAAGAMALTELAGIPLLLLRPSGMHPMGHTGGTLAAPGSLEYAALQRFVALAHTPSCTDGGAPPSDASMPDDPTRCTTVTPGPRALRRLTPHEYDRTVLDLTGVASNFGERFAADPVVDGFSNDAASLVVSPLLAEQLRVAAESIATDAARSLARVSPCAPASPTDAVCARRFVETFGARAFRRPMGADEVQRYLALHQSIAMTEGFAEGVETVISTMLQSPHFLYRSELGVAVGGQWQLTPWEVATELSYLFTGTMPDEALFDAARNGSLATPTGIEAQARRLAATPGARDAMRSFVRQWLDVEQLATVPKDQSTFMAFTPAVRASMRGEFDRFVDAVLGRRGARFPELLTSAFSFVDPTLATFYGLTPEGTADAQGFRRTSRLEMQRMGVLTLGAVMATHARPNASSPVHRGRIIRERLLCQVLPPPPPGLVVQPPMPDARRSVREQYAMHSSIRPCVDCHRLIDPIGFGFEFFDGVGRFRTNDNMRPIDASAEVRGSLRSDAMARDTRALVEHLAASPEVHDCFARQLFRYAFATRVDAQTSCALTEVQARFRSANLSVEELLVALARSVHLTRRTGEAPAPVADAGVADAALDGGAVPRPDVVVLDAPSRFDVVDSGANSGTTPGITTTPTRDSTWETGFCERVAVTNTTRDTVTWTVLHPIMGTITTSWNSERVGDSGNVVFRGAMWNRTLAPGMSAEFGFCARR
jgi:hypothetical protein